MRSPAMKLPQIFWGVRTTLAPYGALRIALAVLLLCAAALKGHRLANDTVSGASFWTARPFQIGLVLFELSFSLWLLVGLWPRWTRLALIGVFVIFFEVSLYQAMVGQPTCGCLGNIELSPWWMVLLDGAAVAALIVLPRPTSNEPTAAMARWRLGLFGLAVVFLGAPATAAMLNYSPRGLHLDLRRDPSLQTVLSGELTSPSTADILRRLQETTGLTMTLDPRLEAMSSDLGQIKLGKAWGLMMFVAEKQPVASRWEKRDDGYALVQAAPYQNRLLPWLVSLAVLGMVLLAWAVTVLRPGLRGGNSRA